MIKFFDIRL